MNVGTSYPETIDRISNIVDSLENSISINILITATGYTKSIPGFSLGRVNVFISKAELTKLILSMELAGGGRWNGSRKRSRCKSKRSRCWGRCKSNRGRALGKSKRCRALGKSKRCRALGKSKRGRALGKSKRGRALGKSKRGRALGKRKRCRGWSKSKLLRCENLVDR